MKIIKTNFRRALMLKVMDGDARLTTYLYEWNKLTRCDQVLNWFLRNRLTSKTLYEWLQLNFGMKILEPAKFVLKEIDRDFEVKNIKVGKDYLCV